MSRVSNSRNNGRSNVGAASVSMSKAPFCKHCDNLQLDTNHWLYSNGVLVCPVLKSTECTNCHKKGHTKSRCTARPATQRPAVPVKKHEPMSVVLRNKYAAFLEEEEEEQKLVEEHNAAFPALGNEALAAPVDASAANKPSYSAILKTVAPAPAAEPTTELTDYMKRIMSFKKKSWADDDSDSDDE